jgi:hypothetical protein
MPLDAALGTFMAELNRFEEEGLRSALQSLSRDATFAERTEQLLGIEARLTLVERLAAGRVLASEFTASLLALLSRARRLLGVRDAIAQVPPDLAANGLDTAPLIVHRRSDSPPGRPGEPEALWVPGVPQLQAYAREATQLNASLCAMAAQLTRAAPAR